MSADQDRPRDGRPTRIAVVRPFPVSSASPFFARLAAEPAVDLTVLYYSHQGVRTGTGVKARDFDREIEWDIDYLDGYASKVLWGPRAGYPARRWTMARPGVLSELRPHRYDLAVVCGWEYFTDWLAYGLCAWKRLPYLLYTDEDVRHPGLTRMKTARRAALGALCKRAAGALYTGTLNRDFYIRAGVEPERLWFSPWAVDNGRFGRAKRADARRELGLKPETVYLLFVGKLIERKRPSHLLEVACRLQREGLRVGALVVGSGTLEADLRTRIRDSGLADCHLLGFRNQSELPAIYAAADAFVLPSVRDPRATVVNEAMAAGLPVVITTGTQLWGPGDLVSQGVEGFVVRPDELDGLTEACRTLTDSTRRLEMAAAARARIANWSYDTAVLGWLAAARTIACPREALPEFGPDSRLANA